MFHKINNVKAVDGYQLIVHFENDESRCYDVKQMANRFPDFEALFSDEGVFGQVKVDVGGYGISWNDELDISCNELWENSSEI